MLLAISALKGYAVEASDGVIGTVRDVLFDDRSWKIRWLVIDTGAWLTKRKVLVHPSSVEQTDYKRETVRFALTKAQIEASPDISADEPVSRQMESHIYDYYGWDPYWGSSYFGPEAISLPMGGDGLSGANIEYDRRDVISGESAGDPHLRSSSAVTGYHIHATDGVIGHVENFLFNDESWDIRYLVVDTRNWWPGKHVLIAPYAVRDISWADQQIKLAVTRNLVKASTPWDPEKLIDRAYEEGLHRHYGWPGYGFPLARSA